MGKQQTAAIDALFGSKTRVKLLHLFMNNLGSSFYVREITRIVDEQINSVRRELANLLEVGVIKSTTADNKLFYEVDQTYDNFLAFREIFGDKKKKQQKKTTAEHAATDHAHTEQWTGLLKELRGVRLVVAAGVLVEGSISKVDLLVAGSTPKQHIADVVKSIEKYEHREINYASMTYDEFYYRLSVKDRFITEIISGKHLVVIDTENTLKR